VGNLEEKRPKDERVRVVPDALGGAEFLKKSGIDLVAELPLEIDPSMEKIPARFGENRLRRSLAAATE